MVVACQPECLTENKVAVADVTVDNAIISTAVPRITHDFHSIDDVGLYAAIYPLTSWAFQPSYGKIYKLVFVAALLIFEIGSVVCATALNSHVFILGRALAGLGSAGIQAGTTLILAECVPLRQRPSWNGIIGRSLLRFNYMALVFLHQSPNRRRGHHLHRLFYDGGKRRLGPTEFRSQIARFDLAGTFTFVSATMCLLLALSWGGSTYAWDNARIVALLTAKHKRSDLVCLCLGGVSLVKVFYLPLWFQIVDGVSAVESAILFIPFMLSVVGGFIFAGFGIAATGYYTPYWPFGDTPRAKWVGFQILCGARIGLGEEQGLYMVQTALSGSDVATGLGIIYFAQTFGGALFVSVAQSVFLENISKALKTLAPNLDPHSVLDGASTVLPGSTHAQASPKLQAVYALAIKDALRVGLILATVSGLGAVLHGWKSLKTKTR
ncbi:hypothetical protein CNMCM5793_003487 [Aspergillus hiratsukae]|uniref:MFS general substrate transporter n=1 Tax=Aspergillus hiratsukae TaxID=1194566 RepID=A0A8H6PDX4_9EURO|nr:hypothetical protein CNMCM5793_003487 [Aspergillus hiratsukae]